MKKVTQVLVYLLFVLALAIALYISVVHAAPWKLIAVYWATSTVKNAIEAAGITKKIGDKNGSN